MTPPELDDPIVGIGLELVMAGLNLPVYLTAPAGDDRLFVVEQRGRIRIIEDGELLPTAFLDLSPLVSDGSEQGLLGLAFHPSFGANGRFFVSYTDVGGRSRVDEYHADPGADVASPVAVGGILDLAQPFGNHNGGQVGFGPDGMFFVALGDGGSAGDPAGNGQNLGTLLGAILRLDVDGGLPFAIPPDNPFVGVQGARPEIWAYGLRNPWRFSFDEDDERMFIADVGQDRWEEVNVVALDEGGVNYGWNTVEGPDCFPSGGCFRNGLEEPALFYGHDEGCSITGGHVYRGDAAPSLAGAYLFSDFCAGWIRVAELDGVEVTSVSQLDIDPPGSVTSFGLDGDGESYVLTAEGGIYRLVEEG